MTQERPTHKLSTLRRAPGPTAAVPLPPRRWTIRVGVPGSILLLCLILLLYTARDSLWPAPAVRVVRVLGKVTTQSAAQITVQAPGWVEADPFPIYVSGLAPGVVDEVLVLEGQTVAAGEVVATLIEDDARLALAQARADLNRRQAELPLYQAALTAAQADWDNPIEQDRAVAVSQAKLRESQAELDRLASEVSAHQATLAQLQDSHERLRSLLPNASAEQDVKQMQFRCAAQQALLEAAQQQRHVIEARIQQVQADLQAAQAQRRLRIREHQTLTEAQAQVEMIKAQISQAEVAVQQAQLRLDRMKIRAPVSGVVMTRLAVPGAKVMLDGDMWESAHVVHLYDPKKLQVRVDVPLADAAHVGLGQPARVVVDVLPDQEFTGRVSRIVHRADLEKNTLEVKVALDNPVPMLKPEMLARIKLLGSVSDSVAATGLHVFVPERLCHDRADNRVRIWRVTAQSRAQRQDIQLGPHRQEGWVEILSGLNIGDMVIADPPEGLKDGQKVKISGEWDGGF